MRARVELNLLVGLIDKHSSGIPENTIFTMFDGGSKEMPLEKLIVLAKECREKLAVKDESLIRISLTRKCEQYKAWVAPRKKSFGQGVNYDEFLRVLRRMSKGDEDGGYLLTPKERGFVVFPGHLMLKLMAYLSSKRILDRRLVLADLESTFYQYGINFSAAAGVRPRLLFTMQEIGLLRGSPDAGDSVEIERPFINRN